MFHIVAVTDYSHRLYNSATLLTSLKFLLRLGEDLDCTSLIREGIIMVRLEFVLFVIVSVFGSSLVGGYQVCYGWYIFCTVTDIDFLSRIIKFILTSSVTQSLYFPQITRIVTVKIIVAIIQLRCSFFFLECVIAAFVGRPKNTQ
jgi:hypothetical protein